MSLNKEFEQSGSWLFRYRSFLPLLVIPLFVIGALSFTYILDDHR
ncbi:MAG: methyltransferase, partial [Phycisphaerae bacterium]|nr:methyltransferase [Phycisphaerae bacterium]